MTELEKLISAKIPCPETGIEIRHTMCDICTPGPQCGIDAYVKDGRVIKIEGTKGFPSNNGKLCTKGAASRQYIYRKDRLKTPMRRVGARGSGDFEPISWDEAFRETADRLNEIKAKYGPEAVVFMCGYSKWFRPFLQRLAYSFGSPNYMTESSSCNRAMVMSYQSIFGIETAADLKRTDLFVAWGANPFINAYPLGRGLIALKERGGKVIVVDPRNTQAAQKLADVYLRPRLGTDGALAHAMAKVIIEEGLCDYDFIEKYVHGFEPYKDYVSRFNLKTAEKVTGVPAEDIRRVAEMFASTPKAILSPSNALTHHVNGFNNHRAALCLMVITGKIDRPGCFKPDRQTFCHSDGGFISLEKQFSTETKPKTGKIGVGLKRFPLWNAMVGECQGMDLVRQIRTGDPYEIKAAVCLGVNHRMYPDSKSFLKTMGSLDFIMADDIFQTDICRYADIVLPASTSFERGEVKCYAGKFVNYTQPVIPPVYDNRSDTDIITGLAKALELDDELLKGGYDAGIKYIFAPSGIEDWEAVKAHNGPVEIPNAEHYEFGTYLAEGIKTPTGKLELYSELIAALNDPNLNPLPIYEDGDDNADPEKYPFVMSTGARLPNAQHSRVHKCSWARSLRRDASVDINPEDAERLGIKTGDDIEVATPMASIRLKANVTEVTNVGELQLYHDYEEANANDLMSAVHLDPYTGFPGYKQYRCRLTKI